MKSHKVYQPGTYINNHPRQIAPKPGNALIRSQGPPRPLSQTSSVSSQQHTTRPQPLVSQSNTGIYSQAPVGPRLEPQQVPLPSLPNHILALPSSLVSPPAAPATDQTMGDMTDTASNVNNVDNPMDDMNTMNGMNDMSDLANDVQYTDAVPEQPWWQAYNEIRVHQVRSQDRGYKLDDKTRRHWRHIVDLEQRVTALEDRLAKGPRRFPRG
ncbi:hypothetical protein B0J13DRAFT_547233 [Dactylonectria estremocensis]|uniref:Uncharacterized protein n=1 Tax=Dactylonectria estremocensis TaxID=1079267 RepID=A0A9P9F2I4_9HYPO|nr:hypothetical protein B0J13DRAFT_547233 [Dactylonectria estremocensis]